MINRINEKMPTNSMNLQKVKNKKRFKGWRREKKD